MKSISTNSSNDTPQDLLSILFLCRLPHTRRYSRCNPYTRKERSEHDRNRYPLQRPDGRRHRHSRCRHPRLRNGMSLRILFEQLQDIRRDVRIPLILMGYLNPIIHFGFEAFCRKCTECGIDGVIIPDLPSGNTKKIIRPSHRNTTSGSSCSSPPKPARSASAK